MVYRSPRFTNVSVTVVGADSFVRFNEGQVLAFDESGQAHRALGCHSAAVQRSKKLLRQCARRSLGPIFADCLYQLACPLHSFDGSVRQHPVVVVSDEPEIAPTRYSACTTEARSFPSKGSITRPLQVRIALHVIERTKVEVVWVCRSGAELTAGVHRNSGRVAYDVESNRCIWRESVSYS